jgi:hypothetical protein
LGFRQPDETFMSHTFDAPERQYVVTIFYKRLPLDIPLIFKHKGIAAVAAHVAI